MKDDFYESSIPETYLPEVSDTSERIERYFVDQLTSYPCDIIGLTDYFSVEAIARIKCRLSDSNKVILPNIELRITSNVGRGHINLHLLFSEHVALDVIAEILNGLECNHENARTLRSVPAHEFDSVTVEIKDVISTLKKEFGEDYKDSVLLGVPFRDDGVFDPGMRKGQSARDQNYTQTLLENVDFFFGNATDQSQMTQIDWARLKPERGRGNQSDASYLKQIAQRSRFPRPIIKGSDAHSFEAMASFAETQSKTWLRGKRSFSALRQATVEPFTRCLIADTSPAKKNPRYIIDFIEFDSNNLFPKRVSFNPGLNSVIGPRSSGKSTLLAHVSHAIDPDGTLEAQKKAQPEKPEKEHGPAEGKSWSAQKNELSATVRWLDEATGEQIDVADRKIFYVPQNYLFRISSPDALDELLTRQIEATPSLARVRHDIANSYNHHRVRISELSTTIYTLGTRLKTLNTTLANLGDPVEIRESLNSASASYEQVLAQVNEPRALTAAKMMEFEAETLDAHELLTSSLKRFSKQDPLTLAKRIEEAAVPDTNESDRELVTYLRQSVKEKIKNLAEEIIFDLEKQKKQIADISSRFVSSISQANKNAGYAQIYETLLDNRTSRLVSLESDLREQQQRNSRLDEVLKNKSEVSEQLNFALKELETIYLEWQDFAERQIDEVASCSEQADDPYNVFVEFATPWDSLEEVKGKFLVKGQDDKVTEILSQLGKSTPNSELLFTLVDALVSDRARLRATANEPSAVFSEVCTALLKQPFYGCEYENDRIGGTQPTTMTAGKRSLFALSVLLNVDPSPWPLLLDQPEDDLDSRSIYSTIAPFLRRASLKRQVIMVTHNANLVVGADSDLVIAVNRSSREFPNGEKKQTFDFISGSLEGQEYKVSPKSPFFLRTRSMEHHICDIVDGGAEAFRKRANRYKLSPTSG